VTGAWKQISKQRRRVDVSYDPSMVTVLQHGTWMDAEDFKKTCVKEKKKRGDIHQPFYVTWVADFMLRQDAGELMSGKCLSDKKVPWQRRRRLGMAVAGNTPTASILTKIGRMQSEGCRLCRIAREARVRALKVWWMKHKVTSTVQAAKKWQQQLRLPTTPSGGTCMTACTLHKSQRASSSLSRLTKKVICGDDKSF